MLQLKRMTVMDRTTAFSRQACYIGPFDVVNNCSHTSCIHQDEPLCLLGEERGGGGGKKKIAKILVWKLLTGL